LIIIVAAAAAVTDVLPLLHSCRLACCMYRGDKYHLFNHNCNTFSNEVANFLTGRNIPPHITNLPQEVLQT